jgi:peptide/nickel transport system permease protein
MTRADITTSHSSLLRASAPRAAALWLLAIAGCGVLTAWLPAPAAGTPLQTPNLHHWLGTDLLGRDFGWRLMAGGGRTLFVATAAACLSILLGGVWGIAAGATGGWIDRALKRAMDVALSVPALVLALVILAALGPGEAAVVIAVGAGGAATFARLARAEAVQIRNREFFLASRALGAGRIRMVGSHLLPNIAEPLAAYGALHFGWAVINAASLTFLGFGGAPAAAEWGRMLSEARLVFWQAPSQATTPALALAATVLAVQRIGEWALERNRR